MAETRCTGGFLDEESRGVKIFIHFENFTPTGPPLKIGGFWWFFDPTTSGRNHVLPIRCSTETKIQVFWKLLFWTFLIFLLLHFTTPILPHLNAITTPYPVPKWYLDRDFTYKTSTKLDSIRVKWSEDLFIWVRLINQGFTDRTVSGSRPPPRFGV